MEEHYDRAGVSAEEQEYLARSLLSQGRLDEANALFDEILAKPPTELTGGARAALLTDRAVLAWRLGRIPLALELAAEGWTDLGPAPEGAGAAQALSRLGYLLEGIGNRSGALDLLRVAVTVARQAGEQDVLAQCLQRLGGGLNFRAIDDPEPAAAATFAEAATALAEGLSLPTDAKMHRALLAAYARSLAGLGELTRAAGAANQVIAAAETTRDRWAIAVGNWVLGTIHREQREFEPARELMRRAVSETERINDSSLVLRFSQDLAEICVRLGDHAGEAAALRHSLAAIKNGNVTLREGLGQALEQRRIAVQAQRLAVAAQQAAARDPLTGLTNRLGLENTAPQLLRQASAAGSMSWLVLVDVDWFKEVNDKAGHAAGDATLREIAQLLRNETRTGDLVARWAGDEFVVLLTGITGDDTAAGRAPTAGPAVAERIRAAVDGHNWSVALGSAHRPTVSIGVAAGPANLDHLFATADVALYQAKRHGRNRVRVA